MKDLIKLLVAFVLYGGLAPLLGIALSTRRKWQRVLFGFMMAMPSLQPGRITFMLGSIDTYRGHAKGYEVSFVEVFALALIIAVLKGPHEPSMPRRPKLPRGPSSTSPSASSACSPSSTPGRPRMCSWPSPAL